MGVTISGMTGRGSIRHNNRSFSAANIDRSRTGLNVTFCQEDLKQVYLWEHLPEPLRPIIEKAQQLIPVPDVQKPVQKQERGHSWGDMSL